MHELFRKMAHATSDAVGSPWAFGIAVIAIVAWALSGPFLNFSTTWQLLINTITTVLTFLMVFLIQNMQNRDAKAIHLKLDELIRSVKAARNEMIDLEDMADEDLEKLHKEFQLVRSRRSSGESE